MPRNSRIVSAAFALLIAADAALAQQFKPEVIERGKDATALVGVVDADGAATGSAFCIDRSGLFVTNAHVVGTAADGAGAVALVVDIGKKSQRILRARVLKADVDVDLALLKVAADLSLTPLELGKDDAIKLTQPVLTFGFPFGLHTTVRDQKVPDVTVLTGRVTSLRRDEGRLEAVQFDGQLNPGNSGGPVVDEDGKVVGVAAATVRGAALNLAIAVGRLSEFLEAPILDFDPPPLAYKDRSEPVTWTIKVQPAQPDAKLPEKLAVVVRIEAGGADPRDFAAQAVGGGVFKAKVTPLPKDPASKVELTVFFRNGERGSVTVGDGEVKVGGVKFRLGDLRSLIGGASPRAFTSRGQVFNGPIVGLGKVRIASGNREVVRDLNDATQIQIRPLDPPPPVREIAATVEVKQGEKVLASVRKVADLSGSPDMAGGRPGVIVIGPRPGLGRPIAPGNRGLDDAALLTIRGGLDVDGTPCGAGASIRPPKVAMGEAKDGGDDLAPADGEIRKLAGHTNCVWFAALSADGRRILTASHDYTARLWDAATGQQIRVLQGHTDHVKAVAFTPDGRRGVSCADDDTVRLWDLETGRMIRGFHGHTGDVESVAVSPDGRRILSCAGDGTVRLWDLETGRPIRRLDGHKGGVARVAFLPDGRRGLSSGNDATVRLWDLETGAELNRFERRSGSISALAVSPDGRTALFGSGDGAIRIWDIDPWREAGRLGPLADAVHSLAFSPDGRRAASIGAGKDTALRLWDLAARAEVGAPRDFGQNWRVAISPDGRSAVLAGNDGICRVVALPQEGQAPAGPLVRMAGGTIDDVAVGGGGRYLLLMLREARKVAVFDANAAAIVKEIPLASSNALIAAGATKLLIAYPDERLIQRWDLPTLTREVSGAPSPIKGHLKSLTLGGDCEGPALAGWSAEASNSLMTPMRFSFVDIGPLAVLKAGPIETGGFQGMANLSASEGSFTLHGFIHDKVHVRASPGGSLYGIWHTNSSPAGFQTLLATGRALKAIYNHDAHGHLAPGPDGHAIYTGRSGRLDPNGKPIGRAEIDRFAVVELAIPTCDRSYYLSITGGNPGSAAAISANVPPRPLGVTVHHTGEGAKLARVGGLDEMRALGQDESFIKDDFTIEKRFHFIPAAKLLVTVPPTNDRLVVRRLDIEAAIAGLDAGLLMVSSPTTLSVVAGQPLDHRIEARSRKGGVTCRLSSGPEGAEVSKDGKLSWRPPASLKGTEATVVVLIEDASGAETFHSITIRVR